MQSASVVHDQHSVFQSESSAGVCSSDFSDGVSQDNVGVDAHLLVDLEETDLVEKDGRLDVFAVKHDVVVEFETSGVFEHSSVVDEREARDFAEQSIAFVDGLAENFVSFVELSSHVNPLRSLSRKDESNTDILSGFLKEKQKNREKDLIFFRNEKKKKTKRDKWCE
jgi:hypothetical protein